MRFNKNDTVRCDSSQSEWSTHVIFRLELKNWIVVSEAIQTILRREGYPHPYEELKKLTRNNKKIDREVFINFINSLNINKNIKEELKKINPHNYTGI